MQGTPSATQHAGDEAPMKAERDLALAALCRPNEMVWLVDEHYDPVATMWQVDLVRLGTQGNWLRQRYRYDVQNRVLYFLGERPMPDAELAVVRRSATAFKR